MTDLAAEIDAAISGQGSIPRETVVRWIAAADDIFTLSTLYRLTDEAYYRIQPELGRDTTCRLVLHYLLECIRQNVTGNDEVEDRWEAARTLHAWFCSLNEKKGTASVLKGAAEAITRTFLEGDTEIRNAVEQGFLEHALEMPGLRPYFEHWASDDRLRPAWSRAIEWGDAHPEYTWRALKPLR